MEVSDYAFLSDSQSAALVGRDGSIDIGKRVPHVLLRNIEGLEGEVDMDTESSLQDTVKAWHSWMDIHQGYQGLYREQVWRSALVLQGLTYQPSGAASLRGTEGMQGLPRAKGAARIFLWRCCSSFQIGEY